MITITLYSSCELFEARLEVDNSYVGGHQEFVTMHPSRKAAMVWINQKKNLLQQDDRIEILFQ
jgi:hypothetical protein